MNSSESVENFCNPDRFNIATVLRRPEYFDTPWNGFAADKKHSIPEVDRKAYTKAYARSGRCATAGSTSPFSPDGDGIRRVRQDEADLPGAVDRRRQGELRRARRSGEARRKRGVDCHHQGLRPLVGGGEAAGDDGRADQVPLTAARASPATGAVSGRACSLRRHRVGTR